MVSFNNKSNIYISLRNKRFRLVSEQERPRNGILGFTLVPLSLLLNRTETLATQATYTLVIELYNEDSLTFKKTDICITGTGRWVQGHNSKKYQDQYSTGKYFYYTKTLVQFKKKSGSPLVFVYFTVHYERQGKDLD